MIWTEIKPSALMGLLRGPRPPPLLDAGPAKSFPPSFFFVRHPDTSPDGNMPCPAHAFFPSIYCFADWINFSAFLIPIPGMEESFSLLVSRMSRTILNPFSSKSSAVFSPTPSIRSTGSEAGPPAVGGGLLGYRCPFPLFRHLNRPFDDL